MINTLYCEPKSSTYLTKPKKIKYLYFFIQKLEHFIIKKSEQSCSDVTSNITLVSSYEESTFGEPFLWAGLFSYNSFYYKLHYLSEKNL